MLKKSTFFDFLNRRNERSFDQLIKTGIEDEDFIIWNEFVLPHHYGNAESEYAAIRFDCALFDVSPIRKIRIQGAGANDFLDRLLTRPVGDLPAMRATYIIFCNEDGCLKDDAVLYKFDDHDYLMMPSDIDHSPYFESLCENFGLSDVSFTECTDAWAGLAIQGPKSAMVLHAMGFANIATLKPFEVRDYDVQNGGVYISRMGFTADLGYECWFSPARADTIMQELESARTALNIRLPGYGLTALQACRLEGGFIVAGWDFSTELDPLPDLQRSPFEVGLGWLVNLAGTEFVGRAALVEQQKNGTTFSIRSFQTEYSDVLDDGSEIFAMVNGKETGIGFVTSSQWSFGMQKTIGNASVQSKYNDVESAWISLDGSRLQLGVSSGPVMTLERRNQVPAPVET